MGAVLALTGNGSFYGKTMSRGIDLAVKHIKAAGGPDIKVVYKDHKSGDPQAGVQAMTELGTAGIPAKLASYGDDILAHAAADPAVQVLHARRWRRQRRRRPEPGLLLGLPRPPGLDMLPGLFRYIEEAIPDAKTIGFAGWDLGAQLNADGKRLRPRAIWKATRLEFNGLFELARAEHDRLRHHAHEDQGQRARHPARRLFGQDPGFFLDQAQTANLTAKIFGVRVHARRPQRLEGRVRRGRLDVLLPTTSTPTRRRASSAKLFVSEFKAEYGDDARLLRRQLLRGHPRRCGTSSAGCWPRAATSTAAPTCRTALQENPTLVSVYGGDDTDGRHVRRSTPTTHSVMRRPMGVFEYKDGKVTTLATVQHRRRRLQDDLSPSHGAEPTAYRPLLERPGVSPLFAVNDHLGLRSASSSSPGSSTARAYGLLGVGFAIILGVTGRFHFAFGFTYALAAYVVFWASPAPGCRSASPSVFGVLVCVLVGVAHRARSRYRTLASQAGAAALLADLRRVARHRHRRREPASA